MEWSAMELVCSSSAEWSSLENQLMGRFNEYLSTWTASVVCSCAIATFGFVVTESKSVMEVKMAVTMLLLVYLTLSTIIVLCGYYRKTTINWSAFPAESSPPDLQTVDNCTHCHQTVSRIWTVVEEEYISAVHYKSFGSIRKALAHLHTSIRISSFVQDETNELLFKVYFCYAEALTQLVEIEREKSAACEYIQPTSSYTNECVPNESSDFRIDIIEQVESALKKNEVDLENEESDVSEEYETLTKAWIHLEKARLICDNNISNKMVGHDGKWFSRKSDVLRLFKNIGEAMLKNDKLRNYTKNCEGTGEVENGVAEETKVDDTEVSRNKNSAVST